VSLNIAYLVAGQALYEDDTASWMAPYQPAVAKAYHIVQSKEVMSHPIVTTMRCIFGRDGVENDFGENVVDNTDCFEDDEVVEVVEMGEEVIEEEMEENSERLLVERSTKTFSSHITARKNSGASQGHGLIWSAVMLLAVSIVLCGVYALKHTSLLDGAVYWLSGDKSETTAFASRAERVAGYGT